MKFLSSIVLRISQNVIFFGEIRQNNTKHFGPGKLNHIASTPYFDIYFLFQVTARDVYPALSLT